MARHIEKEPPAVKGVSAVERALAVLSAFRRGDGALSLAELAERTGLVKSTIMRLAVSLQRYRLLARRPRQPGPPRNHHRAGTGPRPLLRRQDAPAGDPGRTGGLAARAGVHGVGHADFRAGVREPRIQASKSSMWTRHFAFLPLIARKDAEKSRPLRGEG